ncbi:hypothetical protein CEE37_00840 [candidate division LCP-89 bacterium B3_LCP]|uniref:Glutamine amidotransferase domain-containing protein n=1 Tax=candidate division LCP-89 bacterium B3_LCP TaxID=2012998 RepID=A0A532V4W5_UNCL8|nr:MAG: hypothetical protein CEE37_00840 [candidate division LCP-89 bacterium B3_LCP]
MTPFNIGLLSLFSLGLNSISLSIKGSTVLFIILIILALMWAFSAYRKTLPPSSLVIRLILGLLRFATLCVVIFLIFEPTISFHRQVQLKPLLAVIFDDSASMKLEDASGNRLDELDKLMHNPAWESIEDEFEIAWFASGDSLRQLQEINLDSLQLHVIGTDLASSWTEALHRLGETECSACLLITDGGHNAGPDPEEVGFETPCPIFTVGIGDTAKIRDARIETLTSPQYAYKDKSTQITARVSAEGMEGQTVQIELLGNGQQVISRKTINLPPDQLTTEVNLEFTPVKVGQLPLTTRLAQSQDERNVHNNSRSCLLEVRESRIRVLLISGEPDYETMFFCRIAGKLPDLEIHTVNAKQKGGFYHTSQNELNALLEKSDVIVFMGFPDKESSAKARSTIQQALSRKPLPAWFWMNENPLFSNLESIWGKLPFKVSRIGPKTEAAAHPDHYYVIIDPDIEAVELPLWADLPPVQTPAFSINLQEEADVLLSFKNLNNAENIGPASISWTRNKTRLAATLGAGYWRWSFMNQGLTGSGELFESFILKTLRWLSTSPQQQPLDLKPVRNLYSSGQDVEFEATVLSGDGQYVESARIEVLLVGSEGESKIQLAPEGYRYKGSFQPEAVGTYTYHGAAFIEEDTIGTASGKIVVEAYNVEKETLYQNRDLLESIASLTGGQYLPSDSLHLFPDLLEAPFRSAKVGWSRRMFLGWDLWTLLVVLLALEWVIRKRRGML